MGGNIIPYCYIFCDTKNSNDFNIIITVIITNSSNNFYSFPEEGYGQNNNTQPQQQTSLQTTGSESASASSLDCKSIASQIGSTAFSIQNPNSEICDISIMRHSPQITDQNGTVLNKFLVANTLVEDNGEIFW